ncbi:MAG: hypothetical protein OXF56_25935 [Rhodobacteraceae bacterium]|nr:hypothetical protein [Paracoccaceae bacterium]
MKNQNKTPDMITIKFKITEHPPTGYQRRNYLKLTTNDGHKLTETIGPGGRKAAKAALIERLGCIDLDTEITITISEQWSDPELQLPPTPEIKPNKAELLKEKFGIYPPKNHKRTQK